MTGNNSFLRRESAARRNASSVPAEVDRSRSFVIWHVGGETCRRRYDHFVAKPWRLRAREADDTAILDVSGAAVAQ